MGTYNRICETSTQQLQKETLITGKGLAKGSHTCSQNRKVPVLGINAKFPFNFSFY